MSKREEMLALRERLIAENPDKPLACDLAPLFGDLEREYWRWQLENYFNKELSER